MRFGPKDLLDLFPIYVYYVIVYIKAFIPKSFLFLYLGITAECFRIRGVGGCPP